ncbi:hypothetical protein CHS0354_011234 [Potamilus streckersoni]|uniref:General transcription factor IIH subunit 3 n=1 Tax=Potamilus streckersoni TaxID=2493646 RepID=A0AAE0VGA3_9BIVA|nr:hypothetical protein CHS0354_011234 [Potamilus streckersoni]
MSDRKKASLLVVVIDTNPVWWGQRLEDGPGKSLTQFLDSVMVFTNSHLMMSHRNKLAVIAAHTNQSCFLYPRTESQEAAAGGGEPGCSAGMNDGKYELFAQVNEQVMEEVKKLVLTSLEGQTETDSLLAGALAMSLCYIHRCEKESFAGEDLSSRILIIKGSEDNPSQYMNFMNAVFTSQKQNITIDACILDNESGLLQQACDITGGIYMKIPQPSGLLQYLLWVFLPDPTMRPKLTLPPKAQVDYRAACFCHRNLIDIGYVCSVCLSIFCSFSPICSTCQTTFKFLGPPKIAKKKQKKPNS